MSGVGYNQVMIASGHGSNARCTLRRAFWATMLVIHTPAWVASCGLGGSAFTGAGLLRCLLLTLTQLLFVVALIELRGLRFASSPRAWLTMTICVTLLHVGVIERSAADRAMVDVALPVQMAAATSGLAGLGWVAARLRPRRAQRRRHAALRIVFANAIEQFLQPRFLLLARASAVDRAPPH